MVMCLLVASVLNASKWVWGCTSTADGRGGKTTKYQLGQNHRRGYLYYIIITSEMCQDLLRFSFYIVFWLLNHVHVKAQDSLFADHAHSSFRQAETALLLRCPERETNEIFFSGNKSSRYSKQDLVILQAPIRSPVDTGIL